MKILCLFVRHGTERYPEALTVLDEWYRRHGLLEQRTLWIIDNAWTEARHPEETTAGATIRPGNNAAWEFSAWERALRETEKEKTPFDIVHLVTSAFNTLYTEYLNHFHPEMLNYTATRNICLGHIDSYPSPMQLEESLSQSWVRTCFFFLPRTALPKRSQWTTYRDPSRFFLSPESREFRPDAPLSPAYQAHITAWLEGQEMGGHSWHSPVRHGLEENTRFQSKTIAILNEHRLAITLRQAGIKLADFCWLFSLRSLSPSEVADPPAEADQLRVRRRILGIPEQPFPV